MKHRVDLRNLFIITAGLALFLSACSKKMVKKAPSDSPATEVVSVNTSPSLPELTPGDSLSETSIRGTDFGSVAELRTVYFEVDRYTLAPTARAALEKNALYLKENPELDILVEGHCDERGTTQYNLALGQKRAQTIREYYRRLGVPPTSVGTISYGEEKPACSESAESCWTQNRRGETKARMRTARSVSSIPQP